MEPYPIERIPISTVTAKTIADVYVGPGKAAIFTNVLSQAPWSACTAMAEYRFYASNAEVAPLEAEISVQRRGVIQESSDFEMENVTSEAAMDLLTLRATEDPTTARTGTDSPDEVLYVKLSLTACKELMATLNLQSFANEEADTNPYAPSEHPLLLGPGCYFCWAYIGEAGTGSKTHVDVASSDAFLTVLSGKKEWAMVHPLDKHLVMNSEGAMADLFNIDHDAFPEAHRARLSVFTQETGDCVFVPSDAPHCVRNIEASFSITYNFSSPSTSFRYHCAMDKVVAPTPTVATVDLLVFCPALKQRVMLRAYVKDMPAPLPTTDYQCRMRLAQLHAAFGVYGRFIEAERANAVPIGCEVCPKSHRAVYYYRMDSSEDFGACFGRAPFAIETYTRDETCMPPQQQLFPSTSSHCGKVPSFPPLRVLINQPLFSLNTFPTTTIDATIRGENSGADDNGPLPCSGVDGRPRQWHYARYPFKLPPAARLNSNSAPWCRTFLFYSSHDVHGPVSLHPLLEDGTLQSGAMLAARGHEDAREPAIAVQTFSPHFEAMEWRDPSITHRGDGCTDVAGKEATTPLLYTLGDDLVGCITKSLVLASDGVLGELLAAAKRHGFMDERGNADSGSPIDALLDMGLEKVMILVLYFTCKPRIVGFTYSNTFSTVEEPNTICLTSTAADALLKPLRFDDAAIALSAFCNAMEPPSAPEGCDIAVDFNTVPLTVSEVDAIAETLALALPHHAGIAKHVKAVKDACKAKLA